MKMIGSPVSYPFKEMLGVIWYKLLPGQHLQNIQDFFFQPYFRKKIQFFSWWIPWRTPGPLIVQLALSRVSCWISLYQIFPVRVGHWIPKVALLGMLFLVFMKRMPCYTWKATDRKGGSGGEGLMTFGGPFSYIRDIVWDVSPPL